MKGKEEFKKFINNIKPTDKIILTYDKDGDGVSAVTIAKVALQRFGLETETFPFERANIEDFIRHIENEKATHVIVFDISAEQYPIIFESLPKTKFMIIDHHKRYGSFKEVVIIKPNDVGYQKEPANYPTARLSYTLFSEIAEIEDLDWISAVGIISDASYKQWKTFVDKAMKKKKWEIAESIYESVPGQIAAMINASNAIEESRITEALEIMLTLDPKKILASDLEKLSKKVWAEVRKIAAQAEKKENVSHDGKLVMVEVRSKYKVTGFVSNLVSRKYHDSVCIVMTPSEGWVKISARCQSGEVAVNDLLIKSVEGFEDAKAGGHRPAGGAIIRQKDYAKFKKRISEEIKKYFRK